MPRIVILIHRHDAFEPYLLRMVADRWRERGIDVGVANDPAIPVEADVAILHTDLTLVPEEYLAAVRRCPAVINGKVRDISKRAISAHLLHRGEPYAGPVIVKTDRNHAGRPEAGKRASAVGERGVVGRYADAVQVRYRRLRDGWRSGTGARPEEYVVLDSIDAVADAVWKDPAFVVERFLPERRGDLYCLRTWLFLGDRDRHALFLSRSPVIRSHNIEGFEPLDEVPEALRLLRRELKFDYGKFDYTMVDGRPVLFDANRTPAIGTYGRERYLAVADTLADGIGAFLGRPAA